MIAKTLARTLVLASVVFVVIMSGCILANFEINRPGIGIARVPDTGRPSLDQLETVPWCGAGPAPWNPANEGKLQCRNWNSITLDVQPYRNGYQNDWIAFGSAGSTYWLEDAGEFSITSIDLTVSCDDGHLDVGSFTITNPNDDRISYGIFYFTGDGQEYPRLEVDTSSLTALGASYCEAEGTIVLSKSGSPYCGDGNCDQYYDDYYYGDYYEDYATCPEDCDYTQPDICGDDICGATETPTNCAIDCLPDDEPKPKTIFDVIIEFIQNLINQIRSLIGV